MTRLNFKDVKAAAQGRWHSILPALGVSRKYLSPHHGPCPICCTGRNRYRFDDLNGHGTYFCNQCEPRYGDGFDLAARVCFGGSKARALQAVHEFLHGSLASGLAHISSILPGVVTEIERNAREVHNRGSSL